MSNSYTKAAFGFAVTPAEADLLRRVLAAIELIGDDGVGIDQLEEHYRTIGEDFEVLFPRTELNPFDGLLDLFPDQNYPSLDCDVSIDDVAAGAEVPVFFSGDQFGIEAAARLIQRCVPSILPFGFEFAFDCDKLRAGEIGGGYVAISVDRIEYGHTALLLDRALGRALDEGADGFVLAARDDAHGLSFWRKGAGFGRLYDATVFSEAEIATVEMPAGHPSAAWLAMPAPLRF